MRYFLDTEFIEDGKTISLLSIGIVSEDGRELYMQTARGAFYHKHPDQCPHQWVRENVVSHFNDSSSCNSEIKQSILEFCTHPKDQRVEFWADYASYDWIALCQIFGTMMDLPSHFPMYCNDIQQWRRDLGDPSLPEQKGIVHHALNDARYCKELWKFLSAYSEDCVVERGD